MVLRTTTAAATTYNQDFNISTIGNRKYTTGSKRVDLVNTRV